MENSRGLETASSDANGAQGALPDEVYTIACEPAMQACSACAGDYEDPDRTAGSEDQQPDEDGERELHEPDADPDADGEAQRENEVGATRRRRDAVPEGFMNGE